MIFVVFGIIVLIVSFVIALASLIREQNKLDSLLDKKELSKSRKTEEFESGIEKLAQRRNLRQQEELAEEIHEKEENSARGGRFSWDNIFDVNAEGNGKNLSHEQEIERIMASLAKITSEKKSEIQNKKQPWEISQEQDGSRKKLSGEFSLDEFRK